MRELKTIKREQFDYFISRVAPRGLKCKSCKIELTRNKYLDKKI
jgi:hypothetical protein